MADFPGYVSRRLTALDEQVPFYGETGGFHNPPATQPGAALANPTNYPSADTLVHTASGFPVTPPRNNFPGYLKDTISPAIDWFEHVHLLPRAAIDFGIIVTTVDRRFELFNAFRKSTVTLTSAVINTTGVLLPDGPVPPAPLAPLMSFLDSGSTELNPIKKLVRAVALGSPQFDTTIDFDFNLGVGTLFLGIKGTRVALLPVEYESPVKEILQWRTRILPALGGKEQRIALREQPRQEFEIDWQLFDREDQQMMALLFDWQSESFGLPLFHERMRLTAATSIGALSFPVISTSNVDIRVGGLFVVWKDSRTYDVLEVDTVGATTVTTLTAAQFAYAKDDYVIPVRIVKTDASLAGRRPPYNLRSLRMRFTCADNDTGAPVGSTAGWSTFKSKVFLDGTESAILPSGTMEEQFNRQITVIDNNAGVVYQRSFWDRNKHGYRLTFSPKTRADLMKIRKLLIALRGPQTSFYAPTRSSDLTPTQSLTNTSQLLIVDNIGYSKFVRARQQKVSIRITLVDGTVLLRDITAAVELSTTEEQLTVDTPWSGTTPAADVARIEFIELLRLAADDVELTHTDVGRAIVSVPVLSVFDNN